MHERVKQAPTFIFWDVEVASSEVAALLNFNMAAADRLDSAVSKM
jgi:hypothetical protein